MIRFSCPKCDTSLKTPDEKAGTKLLCPECGERVDVPSASSEKKPGGGSTKTATLPRKAAPKTAAGSSKNLFIGLAVGACVLVAGGAAVAMWAMKKDDKPTQASSTPPPAPQFPAPVTPTPTPSVVSATPPSIPPVVPNPVIPTPATVDPSAPTAIAKDDPKAGDSKGGDPSLPHLTSLEGEAAYHRLLRSTCFIFAEANDEKSGGFGSGSLIDREHRLILTAYHVIDLADNGKGRISVSFPLYEKGRVIAEKEKYMKAMERKQAQTAWIEAVDKKKDLAILRIAEVPEGVQPLRLARESPTPGQRIHSLGNPGAAGDGMWIYSPGSVRQVHFEDWVIGGANNEIHRYNAYVIKAASPVNPGDSGGPMINEQKEQIGVAHAIQRGAQLMSTFIDIKSVREFLEHYYKTKGYKETILDQAPPAERNTEIPVLVKRLEDADAAARSRAAEVLGQIGPEAKPAVSALVKAMKDKNEDVRRLAAEALEQIGGLTQRHLPGVVELTKDPNPDVRLAAVAVIRVMGPEAESAAPAMADLLKNDKDPLVRRKAAAALGAIGADGKVAVPVLRDGLKDESATVRAESAGALAKLGKVSVGALDLLGEALKDNQQDVRLNALRALEAIGLEAKPAIPQIHKALVERDKDTRLAAVAAVGAIQADDKDTVKHLIDLLDDKDYRTPVNDALVRIGKGTVPVLNLELNNPKAEVRLGVVMALEQLGADSAPALARLTLLSQRDTNAEVRTAAVKAVTTIQKKIRGQ